MSGTDKGFTEPRATFSTCFAAPFLPLRPARYADLLAERLRQHGSAVWLVNTGWTGGPYGVGSRMPIRFTRAMIRAALAGELDAVPYETDPVFNIAVPSTCPDVQASVLKPRATWTDPEAYDRQAARLAQMFADNFRTFENDVSPEVRAAGPRADRTT